MCSVNEDSKLFLHSFTFSALDTRSTLFNVDFYDTSRVGWVNPKSYPANNENDVANENICVFGEANGMLIGVR